MQTALMLFMIFAGSTLSGQSVGHGTEAAGSVVLVSSEAVDRWYGGEYKQCSDGSTHDIVECVGKLSNRWDARLNAAYKNVTGGMPAQRKKELRDVQRKWVEYRNANCGFYARGEGTISRIESVTCVFALTRDRAQELEMMLEP